MADLKLDTTLDVGADTRGELGMGQAEILNGRAPRLAVTSPGDRRSVTAPTQSPPETLDDVVRGRQDYRGVEIPDVSGMQALEAALAYGAAGLYLAPTTTGSKDPGSILGKDWPAQTSRDPDVIRGWFKGHGPGIALHCGRSGLVVFDVDAPERIPAILAVAIERLEPPLQETRPGMTPGRGHYVFRQPPGRMIGNGLGTLGKGWGEVRGRNGVIIVQPSIHQKSGEGGAYEWAVVGPVPELPPELAEGLTPTTATPRNYAVHSAVPADCSAATPIRRPLHSRSNATKGDPQPSGTWLDALRPAPPCRAVLGRVEAIHKLFAKDELTPLILGPVERLVSLARSGHQGVPEALAEVRTEFLRRVRLRGSRPGGLEGAAGQWERSVAGAARRVGAPSWLTSGDRRVCPCSVERILALHQLARYPFTSKGRARTSETLVLEHLASWVSSTGRPIVRQSQRQISVATGITLRHVNATIARLEAQCWLVRHQGRPGSIHGLELTVPEDTRGTTRNYSDELPSVVPLMTRELHPVFGSAALGPGPAETFRHLPELRRRLTRGCLIRVSPGTDRDTLARPPSRRPLPPAGRGPAPTVAVLVDLTGKTARTIRRHLQRLSDVGLAFTDDSGRWWRYRAHPDWVAERHVIADRTPARQALYDRQRRAWFRTQVASDRVKRIEGDGHIIYVVPDTGETLWVDESPPDRRAEIPIPDL